MTECEICGNEIDEDLRRCPFCRSVLDAGQSGRKKRFRQLVVNLEEGRPAVDIAVRKMISSIERAKRAGVSVITFIHGYGSSGKGGLIREECRNMLDYLLYSKKSIVDFIEGEEFHKHQGKTKALLQRYPALLADRNLNRNNRGITIVFIS